jgi:hypothetical protein
MNSANASGSSTSPSGTRTHARTGCSPASAIPAVNVASCRSWASAMPAVSARGGRFSCQNRVTSVCTGRTGSRLRTVTRGRSLVGMKASVMV